MNSTSDLKLLLQEFDLEGFMTQNKHTDGSSFLLGNKGNNILLNRLLADQLNIYPKATRKVPTFIQSNCWFTPKSYEQCSSESSALFKSRLFSGRKMLDLTGGLGVDDWAFSQSFDKVISLDPDENLNTLVRINLNKLSCKNVERIEVTAENYLASYPEETFDLIFMDADRRPGGKKQFTLADCTPDFLQLESDCLKRSKHILLKLSPMVDLTYLKREIRFLKKIYVVGSGSEVKEVLVCIENRFTGIIETEAILLSEPIVRYSDMGNNIAPNETETKIADPYFFETHPVLIKAGISARYLSQAGIHLFGKSGAYGTGNNLPQDFMGRSFRIKAMFPFSARTFKAYLNNQNIEKANLSCRHFVTDIPSLYKQLKLKEGGENYFFFTTLADNTTKVVHCQKIQDQALLG